MINWLELKTAGPLLVLVSILGAFLVVGVVRSRAVTSVAHFSFLVALKERPAAPVNAYQFDGFYGLQAAELFSRTLAAWVQSPEVVAELFGNVQLTPGDSLQGVVAATPAAQLIQVVVKYPDAALAQALAAAIVPLAEQYVERYNQTGDPPVTFQVQATPVWVTKQEPNSLLVGVAAFVVFGFGGINVLLLRRVI